MTTIAHKPECPGARLVTFKASTTGHTVTTCKACRAMHDHDTTTAEPAAPFGRYRCRTHPEIAVSWRGTGCPDCAKVATRRETRRLKDAARDLEVPSWMSS